MPGLPAALVCDGAEYSQPRFFRTESAVQQQLQLQHQQQQQQGGQSQSTIPVQTQPNTMAATAQGQKHSQSATEASHSVSVSAILNRIRLDALRTKRTSTSKVVEVTLDSD